MSYLEVNKVKISGLCACIPPDIEENINLSIFKDKEEAQRVIESTGIQRKHLVRPGTTASDLTVQAVKKLLDSLCWSPGEVDCLVYVCVSRDYIAPITSAILQDRLGLRNDCFCIDLPLGCSGWVYGMSTIGSLLSHGMMKKGLLVCAETNSLNRSPKDKTVKPLFGDVATVTALEYDENWDRPMQFNFGVDGKGYKAVWTEYGGTRNPITPESIKEKKVEEGITRRGIDMVVNGMDVFAFAIKVPPKSLNDLISHFGIDLSGIDYLFLHQANKYIDERIRKKLELPEEKVPYCLADYGNTNSASIPLTIVTKCSDSMTKGAYNCLACGFGVGLAWASIHFYTENIKAIEQIEYQY